MASPLDVLNPINSVATIADSVTKGLDELFTSDEERERAKLLMMKELNQPHIIQAMTNMEEARHSSIFVAGWRPALGWLTVFLLAYAWVVRDLILIILLAMDEQGIANGLPQVNSEEMLTLVFALLGLGATRTYEKVKGVARNQWSTTPSAPPQALRTEAPPSPREAEPRQERPKDFSEEEKRNAFSRNRRVFPNDVN
ncbi:MAG: hypothetical protein GY703_02885 [Gammaproteobacteria bacterium]|nr:hypothetical protein [Gammaproteobacteria bacterium]